MGAIDECREFREIQLFGKLPLPVIFGRVGWIRALLTCCVYGQRVSLAWECWAHKETRCNMSGPTWSMNHHRAEVLSVKETASHSLTVFGGF